MKNSILIALTLLTTSNAYASSPSCVPYYQKRLETIQNRLQTLGILGGVSGAVASAASAVSPLLSIPSLVILEELTRLQIELEHRKFVLSTITSAKKFLQPDGDGYDLSVDSIHFFVKAIKKYPAIYTPDDAPMKLVAEKILEADSQKVFCNGALKRMILDSKRI